MTAPSLNKTLHLLNGSTSNSPFALLSALSYTWHTISKPISSLMSANLPSLHCPGILDFYAFLIWLMGYRRRHPYYALKFYHNCISHPIYEICLHERIPNANLTVFSDASWQDCCLDTLITGRSTMGYMIFPSGALI